MARCWRAVCAVAGDAMKKPFVIDYQIIGTLSLSSHNIGAVRLRAASLIRRAVMDLEDIGIHFEVEINEPIDAHKRYGSVKP